MLAFAHRIDNLVCCRWSSEINVFSWLCNINLKYFGSFYEDADKYKSVKKGEKLALSGKDGEPSCGSNSTSTICKKLTGSSFERFAHTNLIASFFSQIKVFSRLFHFFCGHKKCKTENGCIGRANERYSSTGLKSNWSKFVTITN